MSMLTSGPRAILHWIHDYEYALIVCQLSALWLLARLDEKRIGREISENVWTLVQHSNSMEIQPEVIKSITFFKSNYQRERINRFLFSCKHLCNRMHGIKYDVRARHIYIASLTYLSIFVVLRHLYILCCNTRDLKFIRNHVWIKNRNFWL